MFGLENQKRTKKPVQEFVFDLENDLKDSKKQMEIRARIEGKIQAIKGLLRDGEGKGEFDKYGTLLHGYTSLIKVMARFGAK